MSQDKTTIRTQLENAGAPDYMILVVEHLTGGREELREAMAALNKRQTDLANERTILAEERAAFVKAAEDMREFANKTYGPDSEITGIKTQLSQIIESDAERRQSIEDLQERVALLERGSAGRIRI